MSSETVADKFDAEVVVGGSSETPADRFDAEVVVGGSSETPADRFDAETAVGGDVDWLSKIVDAVQQAAAVAGPIAAAYLQTSQGTYPVTADAMKKAGEMVLAARGGDQSLQDKIKAISALADRGDPAGKRAAGVFEVMNELAKRQEARGA